VNASLRRLVPSHDKVPRLPRIPTEARYESQLVFAANPALFALLTAGRFIGPMRRVPRLGWLVTDPLTARRLLGDSAHTSLVGLHRGDRGASFIAVLPGRQSSRHTHSC
jgi:hypothetical protein